MTAKKTTIETPFTHIMNASSLIEKALNGKVSEPFMGSTSCSHTHHQNFDSYTFEIPSAVGNAYDALMTCRVVFIVTDEKKSPMYRLMIHNKEGDMLLYTLDGILSPNYTKKITAFHAEYLKRTKS